MSAPRTARRADIQGLRALAVTLVVVYHFLPSVISGGFVGVDVFFVISGFLITGLLLREIAAEGRIRLLTFYGRRIRRLMPAALVTMVVTVVVSVFVVGPVRLVSILRDMAWTSAYLANVRFAQAPEGYFGTGEQSPFLHYWSLAVEEQYYLIWPVLLALVLLVTTRWRRVVGVLLVVVTAGSLVVSVILTNSASPNGYYSLAARAWELAIGGVLAFLLLQHVHLPRRLGVVLGWLGVALVLFSAFAYTELTPFPGWTAAVPTVGTAMVIWSGSGPQARGWLQRLLSLRPARYVGDISYSLYLWHWPVFVLSLEVLGPRRSQPVLIALIGLSVLLAVLSYRYVEQQTARWRASARPRAVLAVGLTVALVACGTPAVATVLVRTSSGEEVAAPVSSPDDLVLSSTGSPVTFLHTGPGVVPTAVPANVEPALDVLDKSLAEVFTDGCFAATLKICQGGDPTGTKRVVLVGDSQAGQWWPAVDAAAKANGWRLFIIGMNGCPLADVAITQGATADPWPACAAWQKAAPEAIANLHPDLVIWAAHAQGYRVSKVSLRDNFRGKWMTGVATTMRQLRGSSKVLLVGQMPTLSSEPLTCLSEHLTDISPCSTAFDHAVPADLRAMNEKLARDADATYFDPTQVLCTPTQCPMISYDAVMYRDAAHLSEFYSARLSTRIAVVIKAAL